MRFRSRLSTISGLVGLRSPGGGTDRRSVVGVERTVAWAGASALLLAFLIPGAASADPLPAEYSGSTHGNAINLDVTAAAQTIDAALGHSSTAVDSNGDPRAHAESANLEAGALGIPVSVVSDEANSDNTTATDSYDSGLGQVDVAGLLDTGALVGTGSTNWAGDLACVPDGTPIATAFTSVASTSLDVPDVNLLNAGELETEGETTLQSGSVVSTSSGSMESLSLINDLVEVEVETNPVLTADSDGTTGTVTTNDYGIAVTVNGVTTMLGAGESITVNPSIPSVASADLTISVGELIDSSSGALASGSLTFVSISGSVSALGGAELASLALDLLPLEATALAPEGGVECEALDAPVITSPTEGEFTDEFPTIAGTGVPGATVTVTEGGTVIGTAVVADDGTWSLVPTDPLAPGEHTIEATQEINGLVSAASDPVSFIVDTTAPAAPIITSPAGGEETGDTTPTVTGEGEPGATVEVSVDGESVGTAVVADDGTWSLVPNSELSCGEHEVTATQTDAAGNTSESSDPVVFTINCLVSAALPTTGSPLNVPLLASGALLLMGIGVVMVRWRKGQTAA